MAKSLEAGTTTWAAYLLVSPTRSSCVGLAPLSEVAGIVELHNGKGPGEGPQETALGRPWRLAGTANFGSREAASAAAWRTSQASGFQSRWATLNSSRASLGGDGGGAEMSGTEWRQEFDPRGAFDGMTYVPVEFVHPTDPSRRATVRALVDTGSTDCDLKQTFIDRLRLPLDALTGSAHFETAAGITVEAPIYRAIVRVQGREAYVRVSPAEMPESGDDDESGEEGGGPVMAPAFATKTEDLDKVFGLDSNTDEALLGHDALAALGLLVDCRGRRLVPLPEPAAAE